MRYQVRRSISDIGPDLYVVTDGQQGFRHIAVFTRAALAELAASRLEREYRAALFGAAQQVAR